MLTDLVTQVSDSWGDVLGKIRDAKFDNRESAQTVADATGIPLSSLTKILSGHTLEPGVYKIVALCMHFNLSMDKLFGLRNETNEESMQREIDELRTCISHARMAIDDKDKQLRRHRSLIYVLIGIIAFSLVLLAYIVVDALHPNWGFFVR